MENRFKELQCAYIRSLINLRTSLSKEVSTSVSRIRRQFQRAQNGVDSEVRRLQDENESLR
ncbi:unnamed protein product, partial [Trichobilharzia szidati]